MLELKNICFQVPDEKSRNAKEKGILEDVSFTLEDNKFVVITGPNGGGKSTLAKIIAGIEKPTSGRILWDGQDITDMSVTDRARLGISYAFQQPVRFKGVTVFDLIRLASGKEITVASACEYLSKVGLCAKDYIKREVNSSLSGGEIKRIEIATIMARKTRVSVFDEPEAGIDLWSFQNLIQVFEEMHNQLHGSILIISHQERILNIADEILLISDGKLTKRGTKEEILPQLLGTANAAGFGCNKMAADR
ncbi:MAG: ATP-binding cassette domain-containing protein [Eubacteriales bacterium]|nr:ATP-binding cassette domain-containing protein [Eubacteriales bacterium]